MKELLRKILSELIKSNKRLESIEELLSQKAEGDDEEPEENGKYQLLDGSFHNG